MNRKGFTLVELLATLVVLGIIMTITVVGLSNAFGNAKNKTEDVFVDTIKDAMEIYLDSDARSLKNFQLVTNDDGSECILEKTNGNRKVYKVNTDFYTVIDSKYKPLTQNDLVNPANKDMKCADANNIVVTIYRDEDFVYYYSIDKSEFECLKDTGGVITNLPEGFACK